MFLFKGQNWDVEGESDRFEGTGREARGHGGSPTGGQGQRGQYVPTPNLSNTPPNSITDNKVKGQYIPHPHPQIPRSIKVNKNKGQ